MKTILFMLLICFANVAVAQSTDSYGGFLSLKGTSASHFHIEEIGGRNMLVTPEGHGFYSLGINHNGDIKGDRPNDAATLLNHRG